MEYDTEKSEEASAYEQYLQIEKARIAWCRSVASIKTSLTDCLTPVVKSATEALDRLREALAGIKWDRKTNTLWVTEQVAEDPLPPWPKENPHRCDAMDALTYNMQIMSQADHDALHGYACGIDLAAGPDMTAYMHQGGGQE